MLNERSNLRDFNTIIAGYEEYITTLTNQIQTYKEDQDALKSELKTLMTENTALISHVHDVMSTDKETSHKYTENQFNDNLRLQLDLSLKEKEAAYNLWQDSLQTIDFLESELKYLQNGQFGHHTIRTEYHSEQYEKQIKDIEKELQDCKNSKKQIERDTEKQLEKKNVELQKTVEEQESTRRLVKKLEVEIKDIKERQMEMMKMKNELLKTIEAKNSVITNLMFKENDYKKKVNEALQLVEAAFIEKDAALQREILIKEEMDKLSKLMEEIVDGTKDKVKNEIEIIETKYLVKLKKVNIDVDSMKEELTLKCEEISQHKKEYKILEEEFERIKKGNINLDESSTTKLLILEKNLESTFQKLLLSEKNNQKLIAERDNLRDDLEQMANYYQQDVKLKEVEKVTLESKIKTLQQELQKSNINLIHLINKVNKNNETIQYMRNEMQRQIDAKEKLSEMKFSEKINEIEAVSNETQINLRKQLEMQIELNNKWKSEVPEITDKLQNRLIELRNEATSLRDENAILKQKLDKTEIKLNEYKEALDSLYDDMRNVLH